MTAPSVLGNIFLLPISISLACYIRIYADLTRMQRRFDRAFKRHIHIRKNLITQILFLFLNFAVFWLPAEIVNLYAKKLHLKDAVQVTKSLSILLDPLIVTAFDTRLSAAGKQLLSTRLFDGFRRCFNNSRPHHYRLSTRTTRRRRAKRAQQAVTSSQQATSALTWNMGNNDDITMTESLSDQSKRKIAMRRQSRRSHKSATAHRPTSRPQRSSRRKKQASLDNHA